MMAALSVMTEPSLKTREGIYPRGLILRYSGFLCPILNMSTTTVLQGILPMSMRVLTARE